MSKTCRFFLQGFCRNGNNCQFEHQNVIRERDGNVSKTFANSQDNKIDGRRIADVRQRVGSREDQWNRGRNRDIERREESEIQGHSRETEERFEASWEKKQDWETNIRVKGRKNEDQRIERSTERMRNKVCWGNSSTQRSQSARELEPRKSKEHEVTKTQEKSNWKPDKNTRDKTSREWKATDVKGRKERKQDSQNVEDIFGEKHDIEHKGKPKTKETVLVDKGAKHEDSFKHGKGEKYSSSGSDNPGNEKQGKISCLCLYQTYDYDMIKCVECGNFSHGICYGLYLEDKHTCVTCSKPGSNFKNKDIMEHYKKENRTHQDKQSFVFKLNKKRVLKSILNQEYLLSQPGKEPSIEFLKIRFGFSGSYASRISLNIVNEGFIKFYGGFSFDGGKIIEAIGLRDPESEVGEDELRREEELLSNEIGACLSKEPEIKKNKSGPETMKAQDKARKARIAEKGKGPNTGKGKRRIESPEDEGEGSGKRTRESSPAQKIRSTSSSPGFFDVSSPGENDWESGNQNSNVGYETRNELSRSSEYSGNSSGETRRYKENSKQEGEKSKENSKEQKEGSNPSEDEMEKNKDLSQTQTTGTKIHRDREGRRYNNKFIWPSRFTQSESFQPNWEPESVALLGKKTRKPTYGQIVNKGEPKPNKDESGKWNFHFILGMEGSLVQVWVFGQESEILEIEKKIMEEQYYLFWGEFKIREKYSSKFKCTNDWAIYLDSKCTKFDLVKKSRKYIISEDSKSEEREIFADRFKPPSMKGKKLKKMREHNAARKKLELQPGQRKITEFGKLSEFSERLGGSTTSTESSALES